MSPSPLRWEPGSSQGSHGANLLHRDLRQGSEEIKLCTQDREAAAAEPNLPRSGFQQEMPRMVIKLQSNQPNRSTTTNQPQKQLRDQ